MGSEWGLVIFDCDGVVADSEVLACACVQGTLADYGVTVTMDDIFDRFLGRSFQAVADYYRETVGEDIPGRFTADFRDRLFAAFESSLQPIPFIADVLAALDPPFCLASSSDMDRIRKTLAIIGLTRAFGDRVFNSAMVERGKPAPDLFLLAAKRMDVPAAATLVVEDTESGVRAGKAAGMTVWGFAGGSHYVGRDADGVLAAAGADRVFSSMAEF